MAGYLNDVYTSHKAYRDALLTQKGPALSDWETRNDDVMRLLAKVRELKKHHGN